MRDLKTISTGRCPCAEARPFWVPLLSRDYAVSGGVLRGAHPGLNRPLRPARKGVGMSIFEEARAAENQSLFRDVNERVREVNAHFNVLLEINEWLCECVSSECIQRIKMTPQEYEAVRSDGTRFAVAPGQDHVVPEVERVVSKNEHYWIVEKIGHGGEIAARYDPRKDDAMTPLGVRSPVKG